MKFILHTVAFHQGVIKTIFMYISLLKFCWVTPLNTNGQSNTVNSAIFASVYFRKTSQMQSFAIIKPSRNGEITLPFTDVGKSFHFRLGNFESGKYFF